MGDNLSWEQEEKAGVGWAGQHPDTYRKACDKIINAHSLVLKISWPETSRPEEWKIIEHAQALGTNDKLIRSHILEVKCAGDLDCYST